MTKNIQLLFLFTFLVTKNTDAQDFIQQQNKTNNIYIYNDVQVNQNTINSPSIHISNIEPVVQNRGNRVNYNPVQIQTQLNSNIQLPNPKEISLNIELNSNEREIKTRGEINKPSISLPELSIGLEKERLEKARELNVSTKKKNYRNKIHIEKFWFKKNITRPIKRIVIKSFSKQKKRKIKLTCSF